MQSKRVAAENVFSSATTATEKVLAENVTAADACSSLPKLTSIARAVNRHRARNRPRHPKTLDFELMTDNIPENFLRCDIRRNGTRHLVFASDEQLLLLSKAKTWYVLELFWKSLLCDSD